LEIEVGAMKGLFRHFVGVAALAMGLCAFSARAETACPAIPGLDAALKSPAHVIWIGELHGTNEMPAFFGDVVCAAGQDGHKVIVALERYKDEDAQIQAFLATPDRDTATSILLTGWGWHSRLQGGRDSEAMLALLQRLRDYKAAGRISEIAVIDDWSNRAARDAAMADAVKAMVAKHPEAWVLVYSGNVHANKTLSADTPHAAGYLSPGDVYSINVQVEGAGSMWSPEQGAIPIRGVDHRAAGIVRAADAGLRPVATHGFDAIAFLGVPVTASPPALKAALDLTQPVHDAFARIEAEQAKLPPATSDRERLERMFDTDQAGRLAGQGIDLAQLPKVQQPAAEMMIWDDEINPHDLADQKALKAMMPATGWFTRSKYGGKASSAAFLIVQHAVKDPDLMRDALKRMTPLVGTGEIDDAQYALLYDRVSLQFDHRPQRYGSQVVCRDGRWQPDTMEDPDHVDRRRKAMGMVQSEAEYLKYFETMPCH
jgi:hypothetical protein